MYILHGTLPQTVVPILKSKRLLAKGNHKRPVLVDDGTDQLFTQLLYRGIPYEKDQYPFHYGACFVLDVSVLKDYPFYAAPCVGCFSPTFREGMNQTDNAAMGHGGRKRLPSLSKLKDVINKTNTKRPWLKNLAFIHSHEILFGRSIPLKKYCVAVVVYKITPAISRLAEALDIRVIEYDFDVGLNRFLDLIDAI